MLRKSSSPAIGRRAFINRGQCSNPNDVVTQAFAFAPETHSLHSKRSLKKLECISLYLSAISALPLVLTAVLPEAAIEVRESNEEDASIRDGPDC